MLCLFLQQHRHDMAKTGFPSQLDALRALSAQAGSSSSSGEGEGVENASTKAGVHGQARHHLNMKERAAAEAAQDGHRDWKFYSIDPIMEPGYIEGLCSLKQ